THCPGALMYVHNYLAAYEKYSYIEYITKLRLYKLVEDIIMYRYSPCANVNSIDDILGMGKQYLKIMQEIDGGYAELAIAQKLTHANIPFNAGYLCWVRDAFGYDAVTAIDYTTYASLERIHRYCSQYADRFNDFRHVFTLWKDYISSCEKLDYDLTNDFVLFPRDLKKSHDMAYKRVDTLRKKNGKKILNNMTKRLAGYLAELSEKYTFENDEYAVIVPSNLNDIVKEGHVLHHCVGTYAERVGGRETVILFIRLKSDIKTPFYTLEMQHNKIIQCRGKMNCKMTADIKSFVDLFEKRISLSADKQHATAG
ncbi:MAG: PcfJ domain-containing protein, partial [Oscillospiraceae bacterium]|nr:PcfJ domain-containing protein [Oscillospiraceae bacterium]